MSTRVDLSDLCRLDEARPHEPDPQIWSDNLSALHAVQPALASQLAGLVLPSTWRPVLALDGTPTWRIEPPGQSPQWLAHSAAPRTRAGALLRDHAVADRNPGLASIGAGAELSLLLERLARWQAVYIFEEDELCMGAVLRLLPLAPALAECRCVLVPPREEERFLIGWLERFPGMLPPGNLICLPSLPRPRVEQLRSLCERVAQRISEHRAARLESQRSWAAKTHTAIGPGPRLATAALTPDPLAQWLALRLAAAARRLGWAATECVMDHPWHVGPIPHAERLCEFGPSLIVCVNQPRSWLPLQRRATVCEWHLSEEAVPPSLPAEDGTQYLAASPRVARALASAGAPPARIVDFFHAADDVALADLSQAASPSVLLMGHLPDPRPTACGIEHSSHLHLWEALGHAAAGAWERCERLEPDALLRTAERVSGVQISIHSLRRQWLRLIERVLIPALVLEAAAEIAAAAGLEPSAVGVGWQRLNHLPVRVRAENEVHLPTLAGPPPLAVIFAARPDPLSFALIHAAAAGYPLMLHAPPGAGLAAQLGSVLKPGQHLTHFAGARELRAVLASLRADPSVAIRRAQRARDHIRAHHTLEHRLRELAKLSGGRAGAGDGA